MRAKRETIKQSKAIKPRHDQLRTTNIGINRSVVSGDLKLKKRKSEPPPPPPAIFREHMVSGR